MSEGNNITPLTHLHANEKRWFAIYTKYKCEKYVVDLLSKKGITTYLPLLSVTKRYTRKIKTIQKPLINCYAFVYINKQDYVKVLETQYVHRFVKIRKNLISIPEEEINILRRVVGEIEYLEAQQDTFQIGQEVEIIAGNLTGLHGILINQQGKNNFVVKLNSIGYQLSMNVDVHLLKHKTSGVLV